MAGKQEMEMQKVNRKKLLPWSFLPWLILIIYPLRHVNWGLDLWDTGYNYANFQYMGTEHMDSMWLFSTYLANAAGNFLMKLPFAGSLIGMNVYTGLFVSVLACLGYWFCTKKLQIPAWIAFVGEMLAISLCWCPTALLYNYLTYVLFLACVVLLYLGLAKKKNLLLFAAGLCLGTNVLVRFSNLPEAALIVAVWAYAVIEGLESWKRLLSETADSDMGFTSKAEIKGRKTDASREKRREIRKNVGRQVWRQIWQQTLWCLGGYLAALAVLFGYIHLRYGIGNYVEGILRLFGMTETATDYKATSMLMGLIGTYVENLYWVIRLLVIVAAGMILWIGANAVADGKLFVKMSERSKLWSGLRLLLQKGANVACVLLAIATLVWLYYRRFCSFNFFSYDSMLRPGVLFLMLAMGIAAVRILHPKAPKEEKLISGLMILVILLTSLGSNNKVYPSMNNLFIAAPYTLWECWKFCRLKATTIVCNAGSLLGGKTVPTQQTASQQPAGKTLKLAVSPLPAQAILAAFLAMCFVQFVGFGVGFSFVESTGAREVTAQVDNNEILKGVKMHPDRAKWLEEISAYVNENDLQGKEVILYGYVPSLSYYLQMPSAFNPWSDLRSYSIETMKADLAETAGMMTEKGAARPVIIVENAYLEFYRRGEAALVDLAPEKKLDEMGKARKWELILEFMDEYGYEETFRNEKFVIFE